MKPTPASMDHIIAHYVVNLMDSRLFTPLKKGDIGVSMGDFLMVLVLLGLWKKEEFNRLKLMQTR